MTTVSNVTTTVSYSIPSPGRTNQDHVVVQLILGFSRMSGLAIHFGHLLQTVHDGSRDAFVIPIHDLTDVERIGPIELSFDARDERLRSDDST